MPPPLRHSTTDAGAGATLPAAAQRVSPFALLTVLGRFGWRIRRDYSRASRDRHSFPQQMPRATDGRAACGTVSPPTAMPAGMARGATGSCRRSVGRASSLPSRRGRHSGSARGSTADQVWAREHPCNRRGNTAADAGAAANLSYPASRFGPLCRNRRRATGLERTADGANSGPAHNPALVSVAPAETRCALSQLPLTRMAGSSGVAGWSAHADGGRQRHRIATIPTDEMHRSQSGMRELDCRTRVQ